MITRSGYTKMIVTLDTPRYPQHRGIIGLVVLVMAGLLSGPTAVSAEEPPAPASMHRGGYVPDVGCRSCHAEIYDAYQHVGMAQSFYRPNTRPGTEALNSPFLHTASGREYRYINRDGALRFQRVQRDDTGQAINAIELSVDWIMGSGNHVRSYLHQTPGGQLFLLPVSWYAEAGWQMSPGYDRPHHDGIQRAIRRECMFCHNAYPELPATANPLSPVHVFPRDMPEGIGCQRCHGPGGDHLAQAYTPGADPEAIRDAIVNPKRLPANRRSDVCLSCHMLPSVAVPGIRRFDRGQFSFDAGDPLEEFLLFLDIDEASRSAGDRFEIDHQAYRLLQSRCFLDSAGAMDCITCHDPHRKLPEQDRVAHYRAICMGCHDDAAFTADHATLLERWRPSNPRHAKVSDEDCTQCHMPKRRTQDVVHAVMTDHFIRRTPLVDDPLRPLKETEPVIEDIRRLFPAQERNADSWDIYRSVATLRAAGGRHTAALDHLESIFAEHAVLQTEPYLDLARAQMFAGKAGHAQQTVDEILRRDPNQPEALNWSAGLALHAGDLAEARRRQDQCVAAAPDWPRAHRDRARIALQTADLDTAAASVGNALALNPMDAEAWYLQAEIDARRDDTESAIVALERALASDPGMTAGYMTIIDLLSAADRPADAQRYLEHGRRFAREPEAIEKQGE